MVTCASKAYELCKTLFDNMVYVNVGMSFSRSSWACPGFLIEVLFMDREWVIGFDFSLSTSDLRIA